MYIVYRSDYNYWLGHMMKIIENRKNTFPGAIFLGSK